jgi:prepilin-type N-terminal cleavage/methylation domain-containing protein
MIKILKYNLKDAKKRLIQTQKIQGFTLIELLMVLLMGGIVFSGLLWLMNNILQSNQYELAKSQTQQETRMAMDYIAEELQEAVYVYDGEALEELLESSKFTLQNDQKYIPVLAFWKIESLPYNSQDSLPNESNCDNVNVDEDECQSLLIERQSYTFVLYTLDKEDTTDWSGKSRIRRYQLRKYSEVDTNKLTRNPQYLDPGTESSFTNWPSPNEDFDGTVNAVNIDPSESETLVDFIDWADTTDTTTLPNCITKTNNNPYNPTPIYDPSKYPYGFFACVRLEREDDDGPPIMSNQDVIVFLKGNAKGKSGLMSDNPLSLLSTQVQIKGVIDKANSD